MAKNRILISQAGMGIVASSDPASEIAEGHTKLAALRRAVELAAAIGQLGEIK